MDRIWITWETQRRNRSMSQALKAELYELDYSELSAYKRYFKSVVRTLLIIKREKPKVLFVQNPSLLLATIALLISKVSCINVVIDAHNGGIKPFDGKSRALNIWAKMILKSSPLTIVTNEVIRQDVIKITAGKVCVLPDPIPCIVPPQQRDKLKGEFNVLFVCTWASDEPFLEVIEAAGLLGNNICLYITGNHEKHQSLNFSNLPSNVFLTGFVPTIEFDRLLYSVDVVMDLTTREGCLVCGAYEAIAADQPVILSDTKVLQSYFPGMVYTNNEASDIADSIKRMLEDLLHFKNSAKNLKNQLVENWSDTLSSFELELPRSTDLLLSRESHTH